MPFGTITPGTVESFLKAIGLNLQPGISQYIAGQPQTPVPGESRIGYGLRSTPFNALGAMDQIMSQGPGSWGQSLVQPALAYGFGSSAPAVPPAAAAPKPAAGPAAFQSYKDPGYNDLEAKAAQQVGMPQIAPLLGAIRTAGERSNANQTSKAGAKTVYQFTPETRAAFQKKYHIDPWASPSQAALAAAIHVRDDIKAGVDPVRGYIGGRNQANWGPTTEAYAGRVYGQPGIMDTLTQLGMQVKPPAFNGEGYALADSLLQQGQANAMKPFSATYNETPLPELPKPTPLQAPDYSAGDKAFEEARPKNPFGATPEEQAKGELKVRRADYFAGMAQALASINWSEGPGIGELFAKMGAGALLGARQGDDEVQNRLDKFDEAMQRYSLALANRDDNKAREAINVANENTRALDQYARDQWQVQSREIERHNPRVENGNLITETKNPDGTTTYNSTPIDPSKSGSWLMARANNAIAGSNAKSEYDWQIYQNGRATAMAMLPYAMSQNANNPGTRDGLFAIGLGEAATALTDTGRWRELVERTFGPQTSAEIQRQALANAGVPVTKDGQIDVAMNGGKGLTKEQQDQVNNFISTQLISTFVNNNKSWMLIGGPTERKTINAKSGQEVAPRTYQQREPAPEVVTAATVERERQRRTSQTVNAKGQVSTTTSY